MFHVFAGMFYYPAGGAEDLAGSFETEEGARAFAEALKSDWVHVTDSNLRILVDFQTKGGVTSKHEWSDL